MKLSKLNVLFPLALVAISCAGISATAQATQQPGQEQTVQDNGSVTKVPPTAEKPDPLKRRLSDREQRDRIKATKGRVEGPVQAVAWTRTSAGSITDEEAKAFKNLANDEERDQFIEQFWLRRNPNPDSPDNEFKDEHYARIAYANEHFAAGKPGWMTDRGQHLDRVR